MADQTFTFGDTTVGRPISSTWVDSNGDKITVRTYKSSATESVEDWKADHDANFLSKWNQYPPAG